MQSRAARLIRDDANQWLERSHADPPAGSGGLRADAASLSSHVLRERRNPRVLAQVRRSE